MAFRRTRRHIIGARDNRRLERAATLTEYMLFTSLFLLVAVAATGALNTGAERYFEKSSEQIGTPVNHDRNAGVPTTTAFAGGGGATSAVSTTTSPPTTNPGQRVISVKIQRANSKITGGGFLVTATGTNGASVIGLTVKANLVYADGSPGSGYCTTSSSGACTSPTFEYNPTGASWQVVEVSSPYWDGVRNTTPG